jgi:hypothetical protein
METVCAHGASANLYVPRLPQRSNEEAILREGFRVDKCKSGGTNYGTWFAYNASYSNSGYAFVDSEGWSHLFVCCVSRHQVKRDDATMRVVGPGGAYPMWRVTYKVQ